MTDIELELQDRIPILTLNPFAKYYPDSTQLKQILSDETITFSGDIVIDLSNYLRVNADLLIHLTSIVKNFEKRVKRFGIVIPKDVMLEGLKVKLIDDLIEIYESKHDAVYNLLS